MPTAAKIRVRVGLKLSIPVFKNAGTLVVYVTEDNFRRGQDGVAMLIAAVPELAGRLFIERS